MRVRILYLSGEWGGENSVCTKEEAYTLLKWDFSFQIFSCTVVMIWAYLLLGSAGVSETWISSAIDSLFIQGN